MTSRQQLMRATRIASLLDGVSYLILVFLAMPLKYFADLPAAVSYAGRVHGGLFVMLYVLLLASTLSKTIPLRFAVLTAAAAIFPFAPYFIDLRFRALERSSGN